MNTKNSEPQDIIKDNRVARLLWFTLGFLIAFFIFHLSK